MLYIRVFQMIDKGILLKLCSVLFLTVTIFGNNGEIKQRDLIVLFDEHKCESRDSSYERLSELLSTNVPIVTNVSLIENACKWYLDREKEAPSKYYAFLKNKREWHLFHNKDSDLMLFVPKTHLKSRCGPSALVRPGIKWYAQEYGFNVKDMEYIDNSSATSILQALGDRKKRRSDSIISDFELLFDMNNKSLDWNLVVQGHGNVKDYRHYKTENEMLNDITTNSKTDFNYTVGLPFKDFVQLFTVLKKINTSTVFYHTCFGVGSNLTAMQEVLSQSNIDYIVVTHGLPEKGSSMNHEGTDTFFSFTKKIRSLPLNKQKENVQRATKGFIYHQTDAQTFAYMPQSKKWEPFFNEKAVQIEEKGNRQFHGSNIGNSDCKLKMGFIDTSYLSEPLYLKKDMYLISAIAQQFSQLNNRAHVMESVLSEATVAETILNLVMNNSHYNSLTLAINELECPIANDFGFAPIDHPQKMLIHLTRKEPSWDKRACVDMDVIMSDNQGKHYFLSQEIASYKVSKKDMLKSLRKVNIGQASAQDIKSVLSKVSRKEIEENAHLAKIIDGLEPKNVLYETMIEKESCSEEDSFLDGLSMFYI